MSAQDGKQNITILLVDDIPETRENIKKLLAFEPDFKVIGTAGTGREGVDLAKEFKPDIIIMDINMPDMDGLQATSLINKTVPTSAVIIMSVQDDTDYMRRAMLAGARDFLRKPIDMDELYNTIRTVYKNHESVRRQAQYAGPQVEDLAKIQRMEGGGRAGHVIVVYSPAGGVGKTTIATNLASGLMKEGIRVLLVDTDLQFGDIGTFLNVQSQTTLVELAEDADDVDAEHFDNVVVTHDSGLKVLLGPRRPELADEIRTQPQVVSQILQKVVNNYDFVVIDTACTLDDVVLSMFDMATKIILVGTPTLTTVKNMRFVLDLFDQLQYPPDKSMVVLNKVWSERERQNATLETAKIQNFLKRQIEVEIPNVDERFILKAILRGVPVIASDRDQSKAPIKQILDLAHKIHTSLMGPDVIAAEEEKKPQKKSGLGLRLGR